MALPLRRVLAAAATIAVTTAGLLGVAVSAEARQAPDQSRRHHATIRTQVHNDHSVTLRSMVPVPVGTQLRENEPLLRMPQRPVAHLTDPVVQTTVSPAVPTPAAIVVPLPPTSATKNSCHVRILDRL